jgi:hypothetical protein
MGASLRRFSELASCVVCEKERKRKRRWVDACLRACLSVYIGVNTNGEAWDGVVKAAKHMWEIMIVGSRGMVSLPHRVRGWMTAEP